MGASFLKKPKSKSNKFNFEKTIEHYRTSNGFKIPLPIYYRNKLYTEEQREFLWGKKLDEQTLYIMGEKIDLKKPNAMIEYTKLLNWYRSKNKRLGYSQIDWNRETYINSLKYLNDL